ncbi:hypothetical protein [Pseudomonas sp. HMWF021]|uniref:hypothetical protein n=1 Tax=Pseudomonas sp. HMWF021 TaxID=2056857 RepID=UPI001304AC74|nr:hypothetical protein [Pseudomonas sp. HMWF021]
MGRFARATKRDRRLMTGMIHQPTIEKKRKKCGIVIESVDRKRLEIFLPDFQFIA